MKKLASLLAVLLVLGVGLLLGGIKWWSVLWPDKAGGRCSSRLDCRSYLCLRHELVGGQLRPSDGYCTEPCRSDGDCGAMACVPPGAAADDLPSLGRPERLCMRRR